MAWALGLKYALDATTIRLSTGALFTPLDYFNPIGTVREQAMGPVPGWFLAAMVVWTRPFMWIGVSMTVRRAAGKRIPAPRCSRRRALGRPGGPVVPADLGAGAYAVWCT